MPDPVELWTMTDAALLALYRGDGCLTCRTSRAMFGDLPATCDVCGVDRAALWKEIVRRGLQNEVNPNDRR